MRKTMSGFTVVEILIVIVVIGILATITIVAYTGSRNRAENTSRIVELKAWQKAFVQYKATNGTYPPGTNGAGYCLGINFPNQKCRDYAGGTEYTQSASTALMTALSTYDPPKASPRVPVGGTVGPYVEYDSTNISLRAVLNGKNANECPAGTADGWSDGTSLLICSITLKR
jgi:prepilin-type N-terminal cleavage/methylation domain-containing protein